MSGSAGVLADHVVHGLELGFHVPDQLELGAAAVQVLSGVAGVEIVVALQIVRQEADAALQGHQPGAPGQVLQFRRGQGALAALQEAPGVDLIQAHVKIHLGQILFVLGAVVGAEADGVAEVVDGQAGHGGVKVDDADALAGGPINENVVQLGVVVGDPQGQLPLSQGFHSHGTVRLTGQNKVHFRPAGVCQVFGGSGQGGLELAQPVLGVVEVHNGLVEGFSGVVLQHALEVAEGTGGGLKQLRRGGLEAVGAFNERHHPPDLAGLIGVVVLAVPGLHQTQGLPQGIAASGNDLAAQVGGDAHKVLHQRFRIAENIGVDPLENIMHRGAALIKSHLKGVIDMPGSIRNSDQIFSVDGKL